MFRQAAHKHSRLQNKAGAGLCCDSKEMFDFSVVEMVVPDHFFFFQSRYTIGQN